MLVKNWTNSYKSLAVVLPTLGNIALLGVVILDGAAQMNLIPLQYVPLVSTVITPLLGFIGRSVKQPNLNM